VGKEAVGGVGFARDGFDLLQLWLPIYVNGETAGVLEVFLTYGNTATQTHLFGWDAQSSPRSTDTHVCAITYAKQYMQVRACVRARAVCARTPLCLCASCVCYAASALSGVCNIICLREFVFVK
jgi:hypothetical protein